MKEWSIININLLLKDRCNNTMQKAISILGGIHLYWENIFGPANWSHDIEKNILLLILKIYFETDYIHDISEITLSSHQTKSSYFPSKKHSHCLMTS
jgi:hypothetical protein